MDEDVPHEAAADDWNPSSLVDRQIYQMDHLLAFSNSSIPEYVRGHGSLVVLAQQTAEAPDSVTNVACPEDLAQVDVPLKSA